MQIKFIKMNGAGNDFVVIDNRLLVVSCQLSVEQIQRLASRDNKVTKGCDQLLVLESSTKADVFMRIYNADGGEVDACGNATRCIAHYMLYNELHKFPIFIETNADILKASAIDPNVAIMVDMGVPKFDYKDIPLNMPINEATVKIKEKFGLENPTFVSMGNPHVVFFVDNLPSDTEIAKIGSAIENSTEIFPARVNVSFAEKIDDYTIHAKTWERGAGLTKACGTGACAIFAAANKLNNNTENAHITFENSGEHLNTILQGNNILLSGAVETEFEKIIEL